MKRIIKIYVLLVILIGIYSNIAKSQKIDFRDNFVGIYSCTKRIIIAPDTSYYPSINLLYVIKSLYTIDVVHVIDSSMYPGFWNKPMRLFPDSTLVDTFGNFDYGKFLSNDSIFIHRWGGSAVYLEYFGHKTQTGIFDNRDLNRSMIFPNPAKEKATINFSENGITNITICNIFGREVFYHNVQNSKGANSETINVSCWAKGMYIVKVSSEEGIKTGKLLVE